jgi:(2Fe-2S) ferredoxin
MSKELKSDFRLVGRFLSFVLKDGCKVKFVRVIVDNREYWIKPDKMIRDTLPLTLNPGAELAITGTKKIDFETGRVKYKAEEIKLTSDSAVRDNSDNQVKLEKACVLICQKSDCWKKGGQSLCQVLESSLQEQGLSDRVKVKLTGCLKQCKQGPNVVVMPDRTRYSKVNPREIPALVEKHFV